MTRPKVSVYVPCHHYGRFLAQCLTSLAAQSLTDWELILIDDASADVTALVAEEFRSRHPERVRVIRQPRPLGLRAAANAALELARGEYLMRLDADDWLDANALLVLAHHLDTHLDVGLVFPNWLWVDADGQILGVEQRKRIGHEAELLDLPAHGACSMLRRRVFKAIGGFDLDVDAQDGHELWLKVLYRHGVAQVETPLFYYRQHADSITADGERLLRARRQIKHRAAERGRGPVLPRVAVIVPVKNSYPHAPNLALAALAGKPLLDYTLDTVQGDPRFSALMVTTDDPAVVAHCARRGVAAHLRAAGLSDPLLRLPEVFAAAAQALEEQLQADPDILVILSVHTPLRRIEHIQEAIDTLLVYPVDQVLSTWEDLDLHYRHGRTGMEPVNASMISGTRNEREALYACNGSIHVLWREFMTPETFLTGRIGHVVMSRTDSLLAKKPEERALLELLLSGSAAR